jgi:hypothetical protein
LELEQTLQRNLKKLTKEDISIYKHKIPNNTTIDRITARDQRKFISKLQKLKDFADASERLNKKNFSVKMPVDSFLRDCRDARIRKKNKADPAEGQRRQAQTQKGDFFSRPESTALAPELQGTIRDYYTSGGHLDCHDCADHNHDAMGKKEEFLIHSELADQKYLKPSEIPPSYAPQQQSIIVLTQREHLLAHLHSELKRGKRPSLNESELIGQINEDEEKEILYIKTATMNAAEKQKQIDWIHSKYCKLRMASTIFDLKISRCRSQSAVEYLSKFPRKFSESAQRIKINSIDDSFIYNEVNQLLDQYQHETKKNMHYDYFENEPETMDPYKKIVPLVQRNKRMAIYDMPEE